MELSAMDTSTEENEINSAAVNSSDGEIKHSIMNGMTNGYDKEKKEKSSSSLKEKHHDKDREKEKHRDKDDKHRSKDGDKHRDKHKDQKDREKDKHRDKDKERDKDKPRDKDKDRERDKSKHSSSSSSKDKHSSSSSSKDKDRDKDRKDRDKDKDRDRSKHHDDKDRKDKEHKSSSSSGKDKEHKSSSTSKHSSSSSSKPSSGSSSKDKEHRDKEHKDRDKERDKDKDKIRDKEKDKERSKDKHSSSSKDKERHSTDKHRSDKDRHSSGSSKDKDKHSSEKKDKDKHREKDKEKSKDKERVKEKQKEIEVKQEIKEEPLEIKQEKFEDSSFNTSIKDESMDDDDDYKLTIKEEQTDDDESKMDFTTSSVDTSALKKEEEEEDDDDIPMAARMEKMSSRFLESDDEDDIPLSARKKPKKESVKKRKKAESDYEEEDEEDFKPAKKKKIKKEVEKKKKSVGGVKMEVESPKKKKKEEEEQEVWKWWEEEKKPDGVKWNFLEHKGPVFAADYEPLPPNVKFYYDDDEFKLTESAEEVATFYARMLDHDYTTKKAFNTNFMTDWRSVMSEKERKVITELKKCNFKHMHAYFLKKSEERKAMSKEEKKAIKEENEKIQKEYGFCMIDGHKEKIGNFKIEPPGLFRGRGEHPKMGKLKRRVVAEDIIINCSKNSNVPKAPPGHKWKEVRHDNSVTWLASWTENVQGQVKYIMLNPSSKLKGEKDWQKYEIARKLAKSIDKIRQDYTADWKSKEMRVRQRAVAMYFIDKLALRAGNEKDEDQADTVGCCSLRVEHIQLHEQKDGKENVVVFDFLGKDSIRYYNEVPVEKRVFKNLVLFMENKKGEDDLFDRLNTAVLNKHLSDLMDGLTAKVFRTYNASWTLQAQLKELTDPDSSVAEKMLSYNRANRAVAILCNHQRAVPKTHDKSMANLREKLTAKREAVADAEKNYKHAKRDAKNGGSVKERTNAEKAKKTLERLKEQLQKLELQETDREENKTIALGTSKLNYLDPRISVAWCKKFGVPVEKIYNKTQRDKFRWAIDMATADYVF